MGNAYDLDAYRNDLDVATVAAWRAWGYTIPAPELSLEDRNDLVRQIRQALQDFDDGLFGKRETVR